MKLSIIVPVLNEAQQLPRLMTGLLQLLRQGCEVIIVDGGSDDGSINIARCAGFTVHLSARGRACQMNTGAAQASGDVFLFLHADTQLPSAAVRLVKEALSQNDIQWGRFNVRIEGSSLILRLVALLMNWRSLLSGIATGDQAIFTTRSAFEAVGGFPDQPLMEDIELSKRLRGRSQPACIRRCATTSGRRWLTNGVWRTVFLMWRLRWKYWRGVPAQQLARMYR